MRRLDLFGSSRLSMTIVLAVTFLAVVSGLSFTSHGYSISQGSTGTAMQKPADSLIPAASVPITIYNNATAGTQTYQQKLDIDSSKYSSLINSNWSNVLFKYQNGTPVQAWIESGNSNSSSNTVVWLKLFNINASSNETIDMLFSSKNSYILSRSGPTGENPTLSTVYGSADNGALVFDFYDNFSGTQLNAANWRIQKSSGGRVSVGNGTNITVNSSIDYCFLYTTRIFTYPKVAEIDMSSSAANVDYVLGVSNTSNTDSSVALYSGYDLQWYNSGGGADYIYAESSASTADSTNNYITTKSTNLVSGIWNITWVSTGNLSASDGINTLTTSDSSVPISNYHEYFGLSNYNAAGSMFVQWARVLSYPPSGAMPAYSIGNAHYYISFQESNLPQGTGWWVNLNGQNQSSSGRFINFSAVDGVYAYTVDTPVFTAGARFVTNATGSITVANSDVQIAIPYVKQYYLSISCSPSGGGTVTPLSSWYNSGLQVAINAVPARNYIFSGWTGSGPGSYTGTRNATTVTISGSISEKAVFSELYNVTFMDNGLPAGTNWSVTLGNRVKYAAGSSIIYQAINGSYNYTAGAAKGYMADPSSGMCTVNGSNLNITVNFTAAVPENFSVTFLESGLPAGTSWSITLNGTMHYSASPAILFTEINGTYPFFIGSINGYSITPLSGTITVNGSNVTQPVNFAGTGTGGAANYTVYFKESGLPYGTAWSVAVDGIVKGSSASAVSFSLPNGSYQYTAGNVSGYMAVPERGNITVYGARTTVNIAFSKSYMLIVTESGLTSMQRWSIAVSGIEYSTTNSSIELNLTNGTYTYQIMAVKNYTASGSYGNVTIAGSNKIINITFYPNAINSKGGVNPNGSYYSIIILIVMVIAAIVLILLFYRRHEDRKNKMAVEKYTHAQNNGSGIARYGEYQNVNPQAGYSSLSQAIHSPEPHSASHVTLSSQQASRQVRKESLNVQSSDGLPLIVLKKPREAAEGKTPLKNGYANGGIGTGSSKAAEAKDAMAMPSLAPYGRSNGASEDSSNLYPPDIPYGTDKTETVAKPAEDNEKAVPASGSVAGVITEAAESRQEIPAKEDAGHMDRESQGQGGTLPVEGAGEQIAIGRERALTEEESKKADEKPTVNNGEPIAGVNAEKNEGVTAADRLQGKPESTEEAGEGLPAGSKNAGERSTAISGGEPYRAVEKGTVKNSKLEEINSRLAEIDRSLETNKIKAGEGQSVAQEVKSEGSAAPAEKLSRKERRKMRRQNRR